MEQPFKILAFGNPLLDTIVRINDNSILNKYNLQSDGQKEVTQEEMVQLYNDIKTLEQDNTPGGCVHNTLRVLKWLLRDKVICTTCGSIGRDQNGERLESLLKEDGVNTIYVKHDNYATGLTMALINSDNRSMVACLGAAKVLPLEKLQQLSHQLIEEFQSSDIVYVEGFFLINRKPTAYYIQELCEKYRKTFVFNISAQYMCEQHFQDVYFFAEKSDILFGNKREYQALAKGDIEGFIAQLLNKKPSKIIVITDGADKVKMYTKDNRFEMDVYKVEKIVDTTGAGDAFVGGFLAGYLTKSSDSSLLECCKLGCYASQQIIQMTGVSLPKWTPNLDLLTT